jgi:hypothetical protein
MNHDLIAGSSQHGVNSTLLLGMKNFEILEKNNQRNKLDLITSLRKYDDRTINYEKARVKFWTMTKDYLD